MAQTLTEAAWLRKRHQCQLQTTETDAPDRQPAATKTNTTNSSIFADHALKQGLMPAHTILRFAQHACKQDLMPAHTTVVQVTSRC